MVEGEPDEDVGVDCEVDDDPQDVHLEPEVADADGVADHGVVEGGHQPGAHAGQVRRSKQELKAPTFGALYPKNCSRRT